MIALSTIRLNRLRHYELFDLLSRVSALGYSCLPAEEERARLVPLQRALDDFSAALRQNRKNSHTPALLQADREAETSVRATRAYVRALCDDPDADTAALARSVLAGCFEGYKDQSVMGYSEKYTLYHRILARLDDLPAEERARLALDRWVERMRRCCEAYAVADYARTAEEADRHTGRALAARAVAEQEYRALVVYLNALVTLSADGRYDTFVAGFNELVADKKTLIAARQTRARKRV